MRAAIQHLQEQVMGHVNALGQKREYQLPELEHLLTQIDAILQEAKQLIKNNPFDDKQEEIAFYKNVLPEFYSVYIYYSGIYAIAFYQPVGARKARKRFLLKELEKIDQYHYRHLDLYRYYRTGATNSDEEFFTRQGASATKVVDFFSPALDTDFCTTRSFVLATLLAHDKLKNYLHFLLYGDNKTTNAHQEEFTLHWTESKTALIELCYALFAAGTFNHGKVSLKQVMDYFQGVFGIDLGNTSRTFQEILSRKGGYTTFIDRLINKLLGYIQKIEDRPSR